MKKASNKLAFVLALSMVVSGVALATLADAATTPAWNKSTTKVAVGKTFKFKVNNIPMKGTVAFTINKKSILKIKTKTKSTVTVKGVKAGTATLKAVVRDKKGKKVKVLTKKITVKRITEPTKVIPTAKPMKTPEPTTATAVATPTASSTGPSSIVDSKQVYLTVKSNDGESKELTLTIFNGTTQDIFIGNEFVLEKLENDVWKMVEFKNGIAFTDEAMVITPNKSGNQRLFLHYYFDNLTKGKYRISKQIYSDSVIKQYAEFTLD